MKPTKLDMVKYGKENGQLNIELNLSRVREFKIRMKITTWLIAVMLWLIKIIAPISVEVADFTDEPDPRPDPRQPVIIPMGRWGRD